MKAKPLLGVADGTQESKVTWGVLSSSLTSSALIAQPLTGSAPPLAFQVWKRACSTKSRIVKTVSDAWAVHAAANLWFGKKRVLFICWSGRKGGVLQACLVLAAPAVLALGIGV
jgi:hypothetical protein